MLTASAALVLLGALGAVRDCQRIDEARPAQYIDFVRTGSGRAIYAGESEERAWLRLHNNTTCPIVFYGGRLHTGPDGLPTMDPDDGQEAEVEYDVQDTERGSAPSQWGGGDSHNVARLRAGYSVVFDVPLSHFRQGWNIAVPFMYPWDETVRGFVVRHHVFLVPEDLPARVRGRLTRMRGLSDP